MKSNQEILFTKKSHFGKKIEPIDMNILFPGRDGKLMTLNNNKLFGVRKIF